MEYTSKEKRLEGIYAPLFVPYCENGAVNYVEYGRLVQFVERNGVQGVLIAGSSGEFANLTTDERKQLLVAAVEASGGGIQIIYNITALNQAELEDQIEWATAHGATGLTITPPYYYRYDDKAILAYFQLASSLVQSLPLYLYNIPGMTHNPISAKVLRAVADSCPNIVGMKDSSMDYIVFQNYQLATRHRSDFDILTGNDAQVLPVLMGGGMGGIIACASCFPKLAAGLYQSFLAGNLEQAKAAQEKLLVLRETIRGVMPVMGHKVCLEEQGFNMGKARMPMRCLEKEERRKVLDCIRSLQLL